MAEAVQSTVSSLAENIGRLSNKIKELEDLTAVTHQTSQAFSQDIQDISLKLFGLARDQETSQLSFYLKGVLSDYTNGLELQQQESQTLFSNLADLMDSMPCNLESLQGQQPFDGLNSENFRDQIFPRVSFLAECYQRSSETMLTYLQDQLKETRAQISMHRDLSYQSLKQTLAQKIDYFNLGTANRLKHQPNKPNVDKTLNSYKHSHQANLMIQKFQDYIKFQDQRFNDIIYWVEQEQQNVRQGIRHSSQPRRPLRSQSPTAGTSAQKKMASTGRNFNAQSPIRINGRIDNLNTLFKENYKIQRQIEKSSSQPNNITAGKARNFFLRDNQNTSQAPQNFNTSGTVGNSSSIRDVNDQVAQDSRRMMKQNKREENRKIGYSQSAANVTPLSMYFQPNYQQQSRQYNLNNQQEGILSSQRNEMHVNDNSTINYNNNLSSIEQKYIITNPSQQSLSRSRSPLQRSSDDIMVINQQQPKFQQPVKSIIKSRLVKVTENDEDVQQTLRLQLKVLEKEKNKLLRKCEDRKQSLKDMYTLVCEKEKLMRQVQEKNKVLEFEVNNLNQEKQLSKGNSQINQKEDSSYKVEIKEDKEQVENLEFQILEQKLKKLEQDNIEKTNQQKILEEQKAEIVKENTQIKQEIQLIIADSKSQKSKEQSQKEEIKASQDLNRQNEILEHNETKQTLEAAQNKLTLLEENLKQLQQQLKDEAEAKEIIEAQREQIQEQLGQMLITNNQLEEHKEDFKKLQVQLQNEINSLKQEQANNEKQHQTLIKNKQDEYQKLLDENAHLENEKGILQTRIDILKENLESVQKQSDRGDSYLNKLIQKDDQIIELMSTSDELVRQNKELFEKSLQQENELQDFKNKYFNLINSQEEENESFQNELKYQENLLELQKNKNEVLQTQIDQLLESQDNKNDQEIQNLMDKVSFVELQKQNMEYNLQELQSQLDEANQKLLQQAQDITPQINMKNPFLEQEEKAVCALQGMRIQPRGLESNEEEADIKMESLGSLDSNRVENSDGNRYLFKADDLDSAFDGFDAQKSSSDRDKLTPSDLINSEEEFDNSEVIEATDLENFTLDGAQKDKSFSSLNNILDQEERELERRKARLRETIVRCDNLSELKQFIGDQLDDNDKIEKLHKETIQRQHQSLSLLEKKVEKKRNKKTQLKKDLQTIREKLFMHENLVEEKNRIISRQVNRQKTLESKLQSIVKKSTVFSQRLKFQKCKSCLQQENKDPAIQKSISLQDKVPNNNQFQPQGSLFLNAGNNDHQRSSIFDSKVRVLQQISTLKSFDEPAQMQRNLIHLEMSESQNLQQIQEDNAENQPQTPKLDTDSQTSNPVGQSSKLNPNYLTEAPSIISQSVNQMDQSQIRQMEDAQNQISQLMKEKTQNQTSLSELRQQMTQQELKYKNSLLENSKLSQQQSQLQNLKEEVNSLKEINEELTLLNNQAVEQQKQLETENDNLKRQITSLNQTLNDNKAQINNLEEANKKIISQNDELKQNHQKEIVKIRQDFMDKLEIASENQAEFIDELKKGHQQEIQEKEDDSQQLQEYIVQCEQKLMDLKADNLEKVKLLEEQLKSKKTSDTQIKSNEIESLKAEIQQNEQTANQDKAKLKQEINRLQDLIVDLQMKLVQETDENDNLQIKLTQKIQEKSSLLKEQIDRNKELQHYVNSQQSQPYINQNASQTLEQVQSMNSSQVDPKQQNIENILQQKNNQVKELKMKLQTREQLFSDVLSKICQYLNNNFDVSEMDYEGEKIEMFKQTDIWDNIFDQIIEQVEEAISKIEKQHGANELLAEKYKVLLTEKEYVEQEFQTKIKDFEQQFEQMKETDGAQNQFQQQQSDSFQEKLNKIELSGIEASQQDSWNQQDQVDLERITEQTHENDQNDTNNNVNLGSSRLGPEQIRALQSRIKNLEDENNEIVQSTIQETDRLKQDVNKLFMDNSKMKNQIDQMRIQQREFKEMQKTEETLIEQQNILNDEIKHLRTEIKKFQKSVVAELILNWVDQLSKGEKDASLTLKNLSDYINLNSEQRKSLMKDIEKFKPKKKGFFG